MILKKLTRSIVKHPTKKVQELLGLPNADFKISKDEAASEDKESHQSFYKVEYTDQGEAFELGFDSAYISRVLGLATNKYVIHIEMATDIEILKWHEKIRKKPATERVVCFMVEEQVLTFGDSTK